MNRRVLLVIGSGVLAAAVGHASLVRPIAGWVYRSAHRSDVPPVIGIGFWVWPVVLLSIEARRLWGAVTLELEFRRSQK